MFFAIFAHFTTVFLFCFSHYPSYSIITTAVFNVFILILFWLYFFGVPSIIHSTIIQKNGTSRDNMTVFTGATDIRMFAALDKFNGRTHLPHWATESCNRLTGGSDGSLFPPRITPDTTLHVFDKDMCRKLPLVWVYFSKCVLILIVYLCKPL